ncbi:uncharacterized protein BO72DRAFT_453039 [Aspergillus fijiensis CBS 313.89]|uniref:Uncharacterized protein n=1 Tax=Aspergillus fijiensis CBS 313.89 TaxID=1448319 RepID=A0A8G1RHY9_9EURO|nr:uncharacterized protein BO72DRAFT_453039 [Aspergillus fijiensis CBS 313.89]RAK72115.1 hypothetical protein BO72DRAFT_453039 [Aspergillus fijiensis CBS 313.89]
MHRTGGYSSSTSLTQSRRGAGDRFPVCGFLLGKRTRIWSRRSRDNRKSEIIESMCMSEKKKKKKKKKKVTIQLALYLMQYIVT